jgi:transposase-like protein
VFYLAQHFLLSIVARTLSLSKVMRLSDDQAFETFKSIRWGSTEGQPVCPKCGCVESYAITTRKLWKCAGCLTQFSVTSGTIFASRKLPIRDLLAAIAIFVNGAKGHSALQLSRDLNVQYKTAFVLSHKIREALGGAQQAQTLEGDVEVDGAYFGGYVKPANRKVDRVDRRLAMHQTGKRRVVVVMRERRGQSADEASHWDSLHASFLTKRINHSECYSDGVACTNWAESFFSRIRRAEVGTHHHIAGKYLQAYANEMAWREDNRRVSNGEQYLAAVGAALEHPVSRQWKGYWQRAA